MRFAWTGDGVTADGRLVATFDQEWLRDRADVRLEGQTWRFRKDGLGGGWAASLDGDDRIVASSLSMWRMRWEVRAPSGVFEVHRTSTFLATTFELRVGGAAVGTIENDAFWRFVPVLEAPDAMPPAEAAFVLWFVRRAVARAAATSASVST
ncbi:hypothetical protein GCM10009846_24860 [Agrococcus versicolor]|uniref:Uncharacterized protein n=1 Tax=Agrococcus versicolor TaxID=501482 RepID=A0ABN3AW92_9MICO